MVPNVGYLANSGVPVSFRLPDGAQAGDTFRVAGRGAGAWSIFRGLDHQFLGYSATLGSRTLGPNRHEPDVAASTDGRYLVVAEQTGRVHTSSDYGYTWASHLEAGIWYDVDSSTDGSHLVVAGERGVYTSSDFGETWVSRLDTERYTSVASSDDGSRLFATATSGIYRSSDAGMTWERVNTITAPWTMIETAGDGRHIIASDGWSPPTGGGIATSSDYGNSWVRRSYPGTGAASWLSVTSDGTRFLILANGWFRSADSGATFRALPYGQTAAFGRSADGLQIVAAAVGGGLALSTDAGATWQPLAAPFGSWYRVVPFANGTRFVGSASNGPLYVFSNGVFRLQGDQMSAVELLCVGNQTFRVLSHEGTITFN